MDKEYFTRLSSTGIILFLLVLSYFLLKPILLAVVTAIILGFLFYPLHKRLTKLIKNENFSAFIMCLLLAALILLPLWFFTPILVKQSIQFYMSTQELDFVTPLKKIFPSIFDSEQFSKEVGSALYSFVTKISNALTNLFADLIRNFPILFLQFLVVFFTFFYALRDQEQFSDYIESVLPFSKEVKNKLFESSRGITISVIYGEVVLGIVQGIILGIGLFLFEIPNALLLTIFAILAGILPVIGTTVVWIPTVIYLFVTGEIISALGVMIFGMLASTVDGVIKPIVISRWVNVHPALILIGMIGGLLLFGVLGVILGPLVLAYLFIILEVYLKKNYVIIIRVL